MASLLPSFESKPLKPHAVVTSLNSGSLSCCTNRIWKKPFPTVFVGWYPGYQPTKTVGNGFFQLSARQKLLSGKPPKTTTDMWLFFGALAERTFCLAIKRTFITLTMDCPQSTSKSGGAALSVTSSGGAALSVTSSGGAALSVTSSGGAALSVTSSGGAALWMLLCIETWELFLNRD